MKKLSLLIIVLLVCGLVSTFALKTDIANTKIAGSSSTTLKINLDGVSVGGEGVSFGLSSGTSFAIEFQTDGGNPQTITTAPKKGVHGFVAIKNILAKMDWNGGDKHIVTNAPVIEAYIKFKPMFIVLASDSWWEGNMPWNRVFEDNLLSFRADAAYLTGGVRNILYTPLVGWAEGDWWGFGVGTLRNQVGVQYSTSGRFGIGADLQGAKFCLALGTESANGLTKSSSGGVDTYTGDGIAIGGNLAVTSIPNLIITAALAAGVNYGSYVDNPGATPDVDNNKDAGNNPTGLSLTAEYKIPIGQARAILFNVATDVKVADDAAGTLSYEVVGGGTFAWEGGVKRWVHMPAFGAGSWAEAYACGFNMNVAYSQVGENDPRMHLFASFSDGNDGPVKPLNFGLIFEMHDLLNSDASYMMFKGGLAYPIKNVKVGKLSGTITPYINIGNTPALVDGVWNSFKTLAIYAEASIDLIPKVNFNLNYSNSIVQNDDPNYVPPKGTINLSCSVSY